eukprot:7785845-Pyramimonas_sp.AAC.1
MWLSKRHRCKASAGGGSIVEWPRLGLSPSRGGHLVDNPRRGHDEASGEAGDREGRRRAGRGSHWGKGAVEEGKDTAMQKK